MHRVDVVETEDGTIVEELHEIMHGDKLIFRSKGSDGSGNLLESPASIRATEGSRQGEQPDRSGEGDSINKRKPATATGQAKAAKPDIRSESTKGRGGNGVVVNNIGGGGGGGSGGSGGNGNSGGGSGSSISNGGAVAVDPRNGSERSRRKGERDRKGRGQARDGCPQQQQDSQVDSGIEEMRKVSEQIVYPDPLEVELGYFVHNRAKRLKG